MGSTGRAAAIYVLLAGLQRGVSLLILPFITHAMSVTDYGAASMLSAASLLLAAIIATPLIQLIIRAAARSDNDGPALLRISGAYCYVVLPITAALIAAGVALFIPVALGVPGTIWAIELLAIGLQPATSTFALWVAQAREDLSRFAWISSSSIFAIAASKLIFVVVLNMGVFGWVLSDLLSSAAAALVALALIRVPRASVSARHIRYALSFTLPLIPHSASLWALTSLSRPIMAGVSTLQQVGLLSFGLNLAQLAGLVLAETNRAVLPRYSRENFPAPSNLTLQPVRWQIIAAFVMPASVGFGIAVVGPLIFPEEYWSSFGLTGVLLLGQAAYGLYLIPMNYLTQTAGLPRYSSIASGSGAFTILILILLLGHNHGALGVAYATTAAYAVMAAVALALTAIHRLEISWSAWRGGWPEISLAAAALSCASIALSRWNTGIGFWILSGCGSALIAVAGTVTTRRKIF